MPGHRYPENQPPTLNKILTHLRSKSDDTGLGTYFLSREIKHFRSERGYVSPDAVITVLKKLGFLEIRKRSSRTNPGIYWVKPEGELTFEDMVKIKMATSAPIASALSYLDLQAVNAFLKKRVDDLEAQNAILEAKLAKFEITQNA